MIYIKIIIYHWSIKESKMSSALRACSLAYLYLSKLNSETAFYKHFVASICIVILSNDIVFVGLGSCGLNPDFKILFWSYCCDSLDCGGGGGGGCTIDYFLDSVLELIELGFLTYFII